MTPTVLRHVLAQACKKGSQVIFVEKEIYDKNIVCNWLTKLRLVMTTNQKFPTHKFSTQSEEKNLNSFRSLTIGPAHYTFRLLIKH